MIFPKQFLAEALDRKVQKNTQVFFPYETHYQNGDKSPFELLQLNYITMFDAKSNEMKDLVAASRQEISKTCFSEDLMDIFPNVEGIENCIKRIEDKHFGKHMDKRNIYYGNITYNYEQELKSIPQSIIGQDKIQRATDATEKLLWDSFKSKHYFSERFNL